MSFNMNILDIELLNFPYLTEMFVSNQHGARGIYHDMRCCLYVSLFVHLSCGKVVSHSGSTKNVRVKRLNGG